MKIKKLLTLLMVPFVCACQQVPEYKGPKLVLDYVENGGLNEINPTQLYDLVITRDIVFADKLVTKEIHAINDRGTYFCKDNIKNLLSDRDFDIQLAQIGLVKQPKNGYSKKDFEKFANCFDKILQKLIKEIALLNARNKSKI